VYRLHTTIVTLVVVTFGDHGRLWTSHDDTNVERFTYSRSSHGDTNVVNFAAGFAWTTKHSRPAISFNIFVE